VTKTYFGKSSEEDFVLGSKKRRFCTELSFLGGRGITIEV
jgi:hypothetical protein